MAEAARVLVSGSARGPALVLDEPLSFWGGLDPETGTVTDERHPQQGLVVAGTILVMQAGRGSSSSSSVLTEALRQGNGPLAIVMLEPDEIVALGAIVAEELYGTTIPVLVVDPPTFEALATNSEVRIDGASITMASG